ncbi:MAG TPA: hypothetical protein CFH79_08960, partial [Sulfurospirillum sp. UBA11407]
ITRDFFIQLVKKLKKDGVIVCSTYIQAVRVGLSEAGCTSEVVKIEQSDIRGIVAFKGKQSLEGVSYKDPYLIYRDKVIITNKEAQMLSE